MSGKAWDPKIWDAIKEQCDELPDGLPLYPIDPPRSQALEEPAPVVNQTLSTEDLVERLGEVFYEASRQPYSRKGIHAVLDELANMAHTDALPTVQTYADELLDECGQHAPMPTWDDLDPARQACFLGMANAARNLALVALAAKDATIAEQAREAAKWKEIARLAVKGGGVLEGEVARLKAEAEAMRTERNGAIAELRARVAEDERIESEGVDLGCGDSSCVVAHPKGQATNGRCRCGPHKLRMVVKAMRKYREAGLAEIEKLEAVVKGLRAKVVELERAAREGLT